MVGDVQQNGQNGPRVSIYDLLRRAAPDVGRVVKTAFFFNLV